MDAAFMNAMCTREQEMRSKHKKLADLAVAVDVELDAGPGGDLGVGVAAEFGLQRPPRGAVGQTLKVVQRRLGPRLAWGAGARVGKYRNQTTSEDE